MNPSKDIGIIVGRFQVNELHPGHCELINDVASRHKRVLVFLGVAPALVTRSNPLDFITRKEMLLQTFPNITVLSLPDTPSDMDWSRELDSRIREACPVGSVVLYGSRDSFIRYYSGHFETVELPAYQNTSGSEVRLNISREIKASPDFRAGVIFAAYNQYPKVYPTVDVAIVKGTEVLLGRKPNQNKFRFIGGFTDPADNNYEEAAAREAEEETCVTIANVKYAGSAKIDDWRYRSEEDKIITHFFTAEYKDGEAEAKDDIAELKWFNSNALSPNDIVAEHHVLLHLFKKTLNP
ncbi:MAG TPA: NUDIX domain-containing protein [Chitinophagales bacterium]|nr:NUDIX domain-containing protein [Chitinophagales bacterium]